MRPTACGSSAGETALPLLEAMRKSAVLSGSDGSVLDPIVAIRHRIMLDPGKSATIDMVTGVR